MENTASNGVRAADRALRLLVAFARSEEADRSLDELARATGLPKSTTHRLLDTLARRGFVELGSQHGSYRLGLGAAVIGHAAIRIRNPGEKVHRILVSVAAAVGESVGLTALDGMNAIVLDRAVAPRPLQLNQIVGASIAAHACASGRVLLSGLPDDEFEQWLVEAGALTARTPHTITEPAELVRAVRAARSHGYALDDEEYELGVRCVAVGVRDAAGRLTHALSVSAPTARQGRNDLRPMVHILHEAARRIATHLGLSGDGPAPQRGSHDGRAATGDQAKALVP